MWFLFCLIYHREAGQNILKSDDHIYALCFCLLGIRTVNSGSKPRSDDSSSTNIYISPYIWWQYVDLLWFLKFHTMNQRMEKSVHDYPNCWNRIRSLFKFFLTLLKFKTLIVKVLVGKKCDNHNCTFFTFLSSVNYNIIWERIQCTYLPTGSFGG